MKIADNIRVLGRHEYKVKLDAEFNLLNLVVLSMLGLNPVDNI